MKPLSTVLTIALSLIAAAALVLPAGCKKKTGNRETAPAQKPAPKPAPDEDAQEPEPDLGGPEEAVADAGAPVKPDTAVAPEVAVRTDPWHRLERPKAADVPQDNLLLAIHRASTGCNAKRPLCPARDQLAAKLAMEVEAATELLEKGTDQQKLAIREALLRVRDPKLDELTATQLVDAHGMLDPRVTEQVASLRAGAAVGPLGAHLQSKAFGAEAVLAIDTLSRIGGEAATTALKNALGDERLKPFWGEVCRGLARVVATDQMEAASKIGSLLSATDRQLAGCRGAEAAFRLLRSANSLQLSVDETRHVPTAVLFRQRVSDPLGFEMVVADGKEASCSKLDGVRATLRVPLDRDAEPIVGAGLVPTLRVGDKDLGSDGVFLFRVDAMDMKIGAEVRGSVYAAHIKAGEPRVQLSGHFQGQWCGVSR